jgi:hypothetical protein
MTKRAAKRVVIQEWEKWPKLNPDPYDDINPFWHWLFDNREDLLRWEDDPKPITETWGDIKAWLYSKANYSPTD